jgi:hypothetical protein
MEGCTRPAGEELMAARLTPTRYDLHLTGMQKFALMMPLIVFAFMLMVYFSIQANAVARGVDIHAPFWFPIAIVLLIAISFLLSVGRLPYRITVTQAQQLEFKSLITVRSVPVADVVAIRPANLFSNIGISGYVLVHRGGKIRYPGQFTGMYMLLHELKQANPALEIRGC